MERLPRMLTLNQAAEETGISYYCVRRWCMDGKIAYVRAGGSRGKILVSFDSLYRFLNGDKDVQNETKEPDSPGL